MLVYKFQNNMTLQSLFSGFTGHLPKIIVFSKKKIINNYRLKIEKRALQHYIAWYFLITLCLECVAIENLQRLLSLPHFWENESYPSPYDKNKFSMATHSKQSVIRGYGYIMAQNFKKIRQFWSDFFIKCFPKEFVLDWLSYTVANAKIFVNFQFNCIAISFRVH